MHRPCASPQDYRWQHITSSKCAEDLLSQCLSQLHAQEKRKLNSHKIRARTGLELVNKSKGKCEIIWVTPRLNPSNFCNGPLASKGICKSFDEKRSCERAAVYLQLLHHCTKSFQNCWASWKGSADWEEQWEQAQGWKGHIQQAEIPG